VTSGRDELLDPTALADELTRVRQRGLDELEVVTTKKQAVVTPVLDQLSALYAGTIGLGPLGRVDATKRLLSDGLAAYDLAGNHQYAAFTRSLFFDERGEAGNPNVLMDAYRQSTGLPDRTVQDRRRAIFAHFAMFLIDEFVPHAEPPASPAVEPPGVEADRLIERPGARRRWVVPVIGVVALIFIIVIVVAVVVSRQHSGSPTAALPPSSSDTNHATAAGPNLTFDDLGAASTIIQVYSGAGNTPQEKVSNGTFRAGDRVGVKCKVSGRTITSDTAAGEKPRRSSEWVEVVGAAGVRQFASLTYGDVPTATLNSLPTCNNVP
jgi:hypothetical protein